MFGIACGYADGNDAARTSEDPIFRLLSGRDPISGSALTSQSTLSRFENTVSSAELLQMSEALTEAVIQRHRKRKRTARLITIDLDPTEDAAHGGKLLLWRIQVCWQTFHAPGLGQRNPESAEVRLSPPFFLPVPVILRPFQNAPAKNWGKAPGFVFRLPMPADTGSWSCIAQWLRS